MTHRSADGVGELCDAIGPRLAGALIATDFDGTLAPLQIDPERSRPVAGASSALTSLTRRGARVAVITGRDARTAVRLGGLDAVPGIVVAGLYGLETWTGGELHTPEASSAVDALRERLPDVLAGAHADPTIWVEDKRLSLVVHARRAVDPPASLALVEPAVRALADQLGLETHPGSGVLEIRIPGVDKAGTLRRLADDPPASAVLYLGDDLGDLPAFAEIRRLRDEGRVAWGVAVAASGVDDAIAAADVVVGTAADAVALLQRLAG